MITSVIAVVKRHMDAHLSARDYRVDAETRVGQLTFEPQASIGRNSRWAEDTRLALNPVCAYSSFSRLLDFYRERFRWEAGDHPWFGNLIRLALPFRRKAVTVIAPDGFELPPIVRAEAAQYGTSIRVVPLSYFPASAIGKISQIFWMPTLGRTRGEMDYPIFPEHVHRFFNEPQNRYHHLIPKDWR